MSAATTIYRSIPYFLPVTSALGILGSATPDDRYLEELRLPFDAVTVYFGADLAIPRQLLCLPDDWSPPDKVEIDRTIDTFAEAAADLSVSEIAKFGVGHSILSDVHERGGYLSGVMLLADRDGRPSDLMGCLVTSTRSAVPAHPSTGSGLSYRA